VLGGVSQRLGSDIVGGVFDGLWWALLNVDVELDRNGGAAS
jgi:hypothetical protein